MTRTLNSTVGSVYAKTPARLHLGFMDMHGGTGRMFGCVGLAIKNRGFILSARQAKSFSVTGENEEAVTKLALAFCKSKDLSPTVSIKVHRSIPRHLGLGSGTQLALAVGAVLSCHFRLPFSPREVARLFKRGQRSGIGIGTFEHGGLIVDGGKTNDDQPPPVIARLDFPQSWRILLISDQTPRIFGKTEFQAFEKLPAFKPSCAGFLCRQVLMKLLPAVREEDFCSFAAAVTAMQMSLGDYFSAVQGSRFTSPGISAAITKLADHKVTGYGQSSWGPTAFVFTRNEDHAEKIASLLKHEDGLKLSVEQVANHGNRVGKGEPSRTFS